MKAMVYHFLAYLFGFFLASWAQAAVTLKIVELPELQTGDQVYAAGNFNGWKPADPQYLFQPDADGILSLSLDFPVGERYEFKFTRGSWATVEKAQNGRELPNRTLLVTDANQEVTYSITHWADRVPPVQGKRSGIIELIKDVPIPAWGKTRDVWVYLPLDYAESTRRYPVLYMYDAQNLFDETLAAFGTEWSVDEALEQLRLSGQIGGMIVVGVANSKDRACEYNVFPNDPHPLCADGTSGGDALNQFIAKELKPLIDQRYRTRPGRRSTFIGGSSMGGQLALKMILDYPRVFSKALALSPSYQHQQLPELAMVSYIKQRGRVRGISIYQDMGTAERIRELDGKILTTNMLKVDAALREEGFSPKALRTVVVPDAIHHESAWAQRFPDLVRWLLDCNSISLSK